MDFLDFSRGHQPLTTVVPFKLAWYQGTIQTSLPSQRLQTRNMFEVRGEGMGAILATATPGCAAAAGRGMLAAHGSEPQRFARTFNGWMTSSRPA